MRYPSLYNPRILSRKAFDKPLQVFLCGPGYGSTRHDFRKEIRGFLEAFPNVRVSYGEDIDPKKNPILKKGDLQTIEVQFAHLVDFTVLILESPGSIAELGTFSMLKNLRPRLFVMVPARFFGSESYINRGPLSLIGSEHLNNIAYFDDTDPQRAIRALEMPVMLFKFARSLSPIFERTTLYGYFSNPTSPDYYSSKFDPIKLEFLDTIIFAAILVLDTATFPEITNLTRIDPRDVRRSLGRLFKSKRIVRSIGKRYATKLGFEDPILERLNTTYLSKIKASLKAVA